MNRFLVRKKVGTPELASTHLRPPEPATLQRSEPEFRRNLHPVALKLYPQPGSHAPRAPNSKASNPEPSTNLKPKSLRNPSTPTELSTFGGPAPAPEALRRHGREAFRTEEGTLRATFCSFSGRRALFGGCCSEAGGGGARLC